MPSIHDNSWIVFSTILLFQTLGMGGVWVWLLPVTRKRGPFFRVAGTVTATALVVGMGITLLLALLLASLDIFRPRIFAVALLLVFLAGAVWGTLACPRRFALVWRRLWVGAILCWIGYAGIMLIPERSEWVMGGWDPGVYINQGYYIAQKGSFGPYEMPVFNQLTDEGFEVFQYGRANYRQIMPGIPIDAQTREVHVYFFRLMPTAVAIMAQSGGLRAATRVNSLIGVMLCLVFWGWCMTFLPRVCTGFALPLFFVQPLLLYHMQFPTTEILQLLFIVGVGLFLPLRRRSWFAALIMALLFLLATLNRVDFLIFGGLFLFLLVWRDLTVSRRGRVIWEHAFYLLTLLAAVWLNHAWSPMTVTRIARVMGDVRSASGLVFAAVILLEVLSTWGAFRAASQWVWNRVGKYAVLVLLLIPCMAVFFSRGALLEPIGDSVTKLIPYFGLMPLLCAGLGGLMMVRFWNDKVLLPEHKGWLLVLYGITLISLLEGRIASLYPYATRRFFVYMSPIISIAGGYGLYRLWMVHRGQRIFRLISVSLLLAVFVTMARPLVQTVALVEYAGMTRALAAVSERLEPNDVVVADHFRWGTPLMFIFGHPVLNGVLLWEQGGEEEMAVALDALADMESKGWRIKFLTATSKAMDIYPIETTGLKEVWRGEPLTYSEVHHHPRGNAYPLRERDVEFRLFSWGDAEIADEDRVTAK